MKILRHAILIVLLMTLSACGQSEVSKTLTGRAYTEASDRTVPNGKLLIPVHSDKEYYLVYTTKYSDGATKTTYEKADKTLYDSHTELKEEEYQAK